MKNLCKLSLACLVALVTVGYMANMTPANAIAIAEECDEADPLDPVGDNKPISGCHKDIGDNGYPTGFQCAADGTIIVTWKDGTTTTYDCKKGGDLAGQFCAQCNLVPPGVPKPPTIPGTGQNGGDRTCKWIPKQEYIDPKTKKKVVIPGRWDCPKTPK